MKNEERGTIEERRAAITAAAREHGLWLPAVGRVREAIAARSVQSLKDVHVHKDMSHWRGRVEFHASGWGLLGRCSFDPSDHLEFHDYGKLREKDSITGVVALVDYNAVLVAVDGDLDEQGQQNLRWLYFGDWLVRPAAIKGGDEPPRPHALAAEANRMVAAGEAQHVPEALGRLSRCRKLEAAHERLAECMRRLGADPTVDDVFEWVEARLMREADGLGVEGVEAVSTSSPADCCLACERLHRPSPLGRRMILCPTCGNKRCPKASHHDNACTGSNEPGQLGSEYP